MERLKTIFTPEVRTWIYRVAVALIALLVAVGALADGLDETIINLIAAILGLGSASLATAYNPSSNPTTADGYHLVEDEDVL